MRTVPFARRSSLVSLASVALRAAGVGGLVLAGACTLSAPPSTSAPQSLDDDSSDAVTDDDTGYDPPPRAQYDASARDARATDASDAGRPDAPAVETKTDAAPADAGPPPIARDARLTGVWVAARPTTTSADWYKRFDANGGYAERISSDLAGTWTPGDRANRLVLDTYVVSKGPSSTHVHQYCVFAVGPKADNLDIACWQSDYPDDSAVIATPVIQGFWAKQ
jgi:hypothetical protein